MIIHCSAFEYGLIVPNYISFASEQLSEHKIDRCKNVLDIANYVYITVVNKYLSVERQAWNGQPLTGFW